MSGVAANTIGRAARVVAIAALAAWAPMAGVVTAADPPSPTATARPLYQPQGAPIDPKVPALWNRFHDHAEITALVKQLAAAHGERCRLASLGRSYGGREMWMLTIGNFAKGVEHEKPAFWIDAGIHANEIQGAEVALYTAWYLLECYGRQEAITRLVDERMFYIVPLMSPDSRDAHLYQPNDTHTPRTGQRPRDDDHDGLVDEDGPDDLDHDGHIVQMRIRDPNGRWKPHPDFPQWMIPCKPDEPGQYTVLENEGFDNDGDGQIDEDGEGYYDPNRNWPWAWMPPPLQEGADYYPLSILENRMVADFIMAHPHIAGAQSYHNAGGMILRPPGGKDETLPHADLEIYKLLGKRGEQILPGYRSMDTGKDLYEVLGGETEWLYSMQGIFSFNNELFSAFDLFGKAPPPGYGYGTEHEQFPFNKLLLFDEGFIPWHEIDHPQFGKVEVGGFKKNWLRQPPSFMLEQECHRNMAFTLYHADQMPRVDVDSVAVRPLGGGLFEITATVINRRLIPTHAEVDKQQKITPPDLVRIAPNGPQPDKFQVLAGLVADELTFQHPREQRREPAELRLDSLDGHKPVYVRWIVRGAGPYTVSVRSIKGGVASRSSDPPPPH